MIIGKRPLAAAALAASSVLALGGCFLTAGSFTRELQLMKDGSFSYVYDGEIQMLGLSRLAEMAGKEEAESFAPYCFDDKTMAQRECEPAEAEAQRKEWDAQADERAQNRGLGGRQAEGLRQGGQPLAQGRGRAEADDRRSGTGGRADRRRQSDGSHIPCRHALCPRRDGLYPGPGGYWRRCLPH